MENWNTLDIAECEIISEKWKKSIELNNDPFEGFSLKKSEKAMYSKIRSELKKTFESIPSGISSYEFDVRFGIKVYTCLNEHGMTPADASMDGIWRYIQMKIVPDIIHKIWIPRNRDTTINDSRMWSRSPRLYLKVLWWFIHIVWDQDEEHTLAHLGNNCDISQIIDRTTMGYRVDVYKAIVHVYGNLKEEQITKRLLSRVLMLNSSYCSYLEPELLESDLKEYAKSLYRELGVDV